MSEDHQAISSPSCSTHPPCLSALVAERASRVRTFSPLSPLSPLFKHTQHKQTRLHTLRDILAHCPRSTTYGCTQPSQHIQTQMQRSVWTTAKQQEYGQSSRLACHRIRALATWDHQSTDMVSSGGTTICPCLCHPKTS
ncbi:hypothetical protein CGRA01v4_05809 [Colletotrichum graminicola]|nr:hypothetical protein CGRA01v4_05809 [Colletotrichum graminicola]